MSKRLPDVLWKIKRELAYIRDNGRCVRCGKKVKLDEAHIDHIIPLSQGGDNSLGNLRTLDRGCHVLRLNRKHRGMISSALRDGIIPPNWRELVWDD